MATNLHEKHCSEIACFQHGRNVAAPGFSKRRTKPGQNKMPPAAKATDGITLLPGACVTAPGHQN
jgi:hypothetical protein